MGALNREVSPDELCEFVRDQFGGERTGVYRCGPLATILASMLKLQGGHVVQAVGGDVTCNGVVTGHCWVVCDGIILDPTSGQFSGPRKYSRETHPVCLVPS